MAFRFTKAAAVQCKLTLWQFIDDSGANVGVGYWRRSLANVVNNIECWPSSITCKCWHILNISTQCRGAKVQDRATFKRFKRFRGVWKRFRSDFELFISEPILLGFSYFWPQAGPCRTLANIDNIWDVEPRHPLQILQYVAYWQPLANVGTIYSIFCQRLRAGAQD